MVAAADKAVGTGEEVATVDENTGAAEVSLPWLTPRARGRSRRRGRGCGNDRVVSAADMVVWRWVGVTAMELTAATEVNTQVYMPPFAPLFATLTLLLLLAACPRNPPLESVLYLQQNAGGIG